MQSIQDICREKREQQRITAQMIADESGVSFSTVNNFFSSASKKPTVETTGPICKVLGVSLDQYFGIETPERELSEHEQALLERDLSHEREKVRMLEASIRQKNRVIYLLFGMCAVLSALLVMYLVIDSRITNAGLIQFGNPSVMGWVMIGIVVVSVMFLGWAINHTRKK